MVIQPEYEAGDPELAAIHRKSNRRKAELYWLGFLRGVLASDSIESLELLSLKIEAEFFLRHLNDPDALDLLQDLEAGYQDAEQEIQGVVECIVGERCRELHVEDPKDETNEFYGFCAGIACDNRITPKEVEKLLAKTHALPQLLADHRIASLQKVARMAIADGRITPEESEDICGWITRLVGESCADTGLPTFGNSAAFNDLLRDPTHIRFEGSSFVVTGAFSIAPRKVLSKLILDLGGDVKRSVTRKTDYLVIAFDPSRDWKHSHEGEKLIKAREFREKRGRPDLVGEYTFKAALGDLL